MSVPGSFLVFSESETWAATAAILDREEIAVSYRSGRLVFGKWVWQKKSMRSWFIWRRSRDTILGDQ
jgi:hypothetical protein